MGFFSLTAFLGFSLVVFAGLVGSEMGFKLSNFGSGLTTFLALIEDFFSIGGSFGGSSLASSTGWTSFCFETDLGLITGFAMTADFFFSDDFLVGSGILDFRAWIVDEDFFILNVYYFPDKMAPVPVSNTRNTTDPMMITMSISSVVMSQYLKGF